MAKPKHVIPEAVSNSGPAIGSRPAAGTQAPCSRPRMWSGTQSACSRLRTGTPMGQAKRELFAGKNHISQAVVSAKRSRLTMPQRKTQIRKCRSHIGGKRIDIYRPGSAMLTEPVHVWYMKPNGFWSLQVNCVTVQACSARRLEPKIP